MEEADRLATENMKLKAQIEALNAVILQRRNMIGFLDIRAALRSARSTSTSTSLNATVFRTSLEVTKEGSTCTRSN
jgi:hypothetical protein